MRRFGQQLHKLKSLAPHFEDFETPAHKINFRCFCQLVSTQNLETLKENTNVSPVHVYEAELPMQSHVVATFQPLSPLFVIDCRIRLSRS